MVLSLPNSGAVDATWASGTSGNRTSRDAVLTVPPPVGPVLAGTCGLFQNDSLLPTSWKVAVCTLPPQPLCEVLRTSVRFASRHAHTASTTRSDASRKDLMDACTSRMPGPWIARAGDNNDVGSEPRGSLSPGKMIVEDDSPAAGLFVLSGGKRRSRKHLRYVSRSRTCFWCNVSG